MLKIFLFSNIFLLYTSERARDSLLGVTGFPYCHLIQSQLCAHSAISVPHHLWSAARLIGSVYLIGSLSAALYKSFIFSFKIRVIFVKPLRHIFSILQYYFSMREWKAWDSLLDVTGFPYCRLIQSQLCAHSAPGFGRGKRDARFAWTRFKIRVIFVKLLRRIFS